MELTQGINKNGHVKCIAKQTLKGWPFEVVL